MTDQQTKDLEEAVWRYQSSLIHYVEQMLPDRRDQAQDVVQNTFLRYRRALLGRKKIQHLSGWLYRVAHNLAVDLNRREGRSLELDENVTQQAEPSTTATAPPEPNEALELNEATDIAMCELRKLPGDDRQVLLLKLIEGLTLKEISKITGAKIGTIHYRLNRGLQVLKDRFKALDMIS
ncbi:MAG: RNA polymerase sigma factor [Lentisphaeria bacterium]|nr:RNA polymerase sigma factor [Lentisphaeria bacterium]